MVKYGLLVQLEAKPGQEAELEAMLGGALPLAQAEAKARTWYAFRRGPTAFGIFGSFDDETGRQAHLEGEIAKTLMDNADRLLAKLPQIDKIEVLAAK